MNINQLFSRTILCDYHHRFYGDKDINNLIADNLTSSRSSSKKINIILIQYTKNILAKNNAGTITDYQINVKTTFKIQKDGSDFIVEKFNFQKTDKYEEKNYELNIKKNLAASISQKLILRLALIK